MLNVAVAGALALGMLVTPASIDTTAAAAAPTEKITVDVQTVNGSGCPAGTATVTASADNTSFVVSYNDFLALAGGSANAVDSRKNCQINALVHVPQGFTYGIARADYRGFGHLLAGASATQLAHYYVTGASETAESSHVFSGPMDGFWSASDREQVSEVVYAPCGRDSLFNINTELRVNPGSSKGTSLMTMDSTRGTVRTIFQLTWKSCA